MQQPTRSTLPPPPLPEGERREREEARRRIPRKQQALARLVEAYSAVDEEYRGPRRAPQG